MREALFRMLGASVQDARVLDLFAGSGALGIEALSRGARERRRSSTARRARSPPCEANLAALGIAAAVRRTEALAAWLRDGIGAPRRIRSRVPRPALPACRRAGAELSEALRGVLAPGALVVTESDRRDPLALDLPLTDERRYGDTLIRIHDHLIHRIAVCPGSYDPITNGHLDIIARAAMLFDEVVVGVVNLPLRKGRRCSDVEERLGFIEEATAHLDNVRVEPFERSSSTSPASIGARRSSRGCARSRTSSTSSR